MREILFRGKRVDNGEWVEGSLIRSDEFYGDKRKKPLYYICPFDTTFEYDECYDDSDEVNPDTIGQYTGLIEKNGTKVFEGDIVKYTRTRMYAPSASFNGQDLVSKHLIYWNEDKHCFYQDHYTEKRCIGAGGIVFKDERTEENIIEVIGNIYDNPELLKNIKE